MRGRRDCGDKPNRFRARAQASGLIGTLTLRGADALPASSLRCPASPLSITPHFEDELALSWRGGGLNVRGMFRLRHPAARSPVLFLLAALAGAGAGYAWFWRPAVRPGATPFQPRAHQADGAGDALPMAAGPASDKAALLLAAAQNPRDVLRCEHDLFLATQQLEARDFTLLAADPAGVMALIKRFENMPWQIQQDFGAGIVARWLEVDADGAVAWLKRAPELFKKDENAEATVLRALARKRPVDVLAHLLALPAGEKRKQYAQMLMEVVGENDPAHAAQWLDRFPDKATREAGEFGRREATVKSDPLAAVAMVAGMEDRMKANQLVRTAVSEASRRGAGTLRALAAQATDPQMLAQIARAMMEHDPVEAARMTGDLLTNADSAVRSRAEGSLQSICGAFAKKDTMGAAEWADALPALSRAKALAGVARIWAASDPQAALAWFAEHPARETNQPDKPMAQQVDAGTEAFGVWLGRDEEAARAWAAALPPGEARESAEARLIIHLTQNGRAAQAGELRDVVTADASGWLGRQVAEGIAQTDPLAAARWAAELPAGPAQEQAVSAAVKRWGERDPAAAANWITQFPPGDVRDRAVAAYSEMAAGADPRAASEWVLQVDDPWQRTQAARNVFWRWRNQDATAALAWFRAVPGLDAEVRRQILYDNHASK